MLTQKHTRCVVFFGALVNILPHPYSKRTPCRKEQNQQIEILNINLIALLAISNTSKQVFRSRPRVSLPRTRPPPPQRKNRNRRRDHTRVIHVQRRDRSKRREHQDDADEEDPRAGDGVDGFLEFAERVRAGDEGDAVGVDVAGEDHGGVREVEGRGGDGEDGEDGQG